jgi:structural maintenance of chromosomes protein 5
MRIDDYISQMGQLGFQGYAIEYVDCPDGLMWFLKRDLNLHRTVRQSSIAKIRCVWCQWQAIGLDGSKVAINQAMNAVSRPGPRGEGGANFVAGTIMNMVQRSRYGNKAPLNMTRDVRAARNLAESISELHSWGFVHFCGVWRIFGLIVDPAEKKRIDDKIKDAKVALAAIEQDMQKITDDMQGFKQEDHEYQKNHVRSCDTPPIWILYWQ